jgi:hypothetical protein
VFTVDTDTYANREALKQSGDETAYAESVKKRKHFLASTDFCDWTKKVVYSEKAKDMVFRFNGNIVYRYNPNDGKYYSSYEVNKIYRVDENTEPSSNLNIEFFYADGFMDKEYIEESGKAVMRGFTPFYDTTTKKSWFTPIELVLEETQIRQMLPRSVWLHLMTTMRFAEQCFLARLSMEHSVLTLR